MNHVAAPYHGIALYRLPPAFFEDVRRAHNEVCSAYLPADVQRPHVRVEPGPMGFFIKLYDPRSNDPILSVDDFEAFLRR